MGSGGGRACPQEKLKLGDAVKSLSMKGMSSCFVSGICRPNVRLHQQNKIVIRLLAELFKPMSIDF